MSINEHFACREMISYDITSIFVDQIQDGEGLQAVKGVGLLRESKSSSIIFLLLNHEVDRNSEIYIFMYNIF